MKQLRIPAVFMRGGTSNAVVFNVSAWFPLPVLESPLVFE